MAASCYDACLARLLVHEGGYTNNPADPGGPTNFGITIADYRRYVKPGATAADVKAMRVEEAKAIYRARYWDALRCDDLPAGVDDSVFDYGVNSGVSRAAKVLQRLCSVPDDGRIGPVTLAAVAARDPKALIAATCDERLAFLRSLRTWPTFGKGWSARVAEVRAYALLLAAAVPADAAVPLPQPRPDIREIGKGQVTPPALLHNAPVAAAGGSAAVAAGLWGWIAMHPGLAALAALAAAGAVAALVVALKARRESQQDAPTPGIVPVPARA